MKEYDNKNFTFRGRLAAALLMCALVVSQGHVRGAEAVPHFVADSYVNLGAPRALQLPANNPLTIEGWVKLDTITEAAMLYSKNPARQDPYTYMFGLTGTGTKMGAFTGASGEPVNIWQEATLPSAVTTGCWYHLAFVCDGTAVSFYLDGACVGRKPFSFGNTEEHTVKVGGYKDTTDIQGNLSDVRVWNHARTPAQIKAFKDCRLNGAEEGLLGYWPMNEGSGRVVADGTGMNDGTFSGAVTWVTAAGLTLTAASDDFITALPFTLADPVTGSTYFTGSNRVNVAAWPVPNTCNFYQITTSGDVTHLDARGWLSTNLPPAPQTFARPATATNLRFYAWFTNSAAAAPVHRAEASIFYTETLPVPTSRVALAIQLLPGRKVIIHGSDLDAGSTGGQAQNATLAIDRYDAVCANPGDDQTPHDSFVTLASEGVYPLLLRVRNEAGCTATSPVACRVTVTAAAVDTNYWVGAGGTDIWHNAANWSAGVPTANQNVAILTSKGVRLTQATAPLNSFLLGTNQTLTVEGWESSLKAITMIVNGTITHANNEGMTEDWITWTPQHRILLEGSNITVAANASLDANGKGYRRNQGPGTPAGWGSGAGHAGEGGFGLGRDGGPTYGDIHAPVEPGSGGGTTAYYHSQSGDGGGAIRVVADGCLTVSGSIRANGRNYYNTHGSGGSGGSIWIDCRTLAGTSAGLFQVNGGAGHSWGAGGSGGRIALHYDSAAQAALTDPRPAIRFEGIPGAVSTGYNSETFRPGMGTLSLTDTLLIDGNFTAKRLQDVQIAGPGWTEWAVAALTLDDCSIGLQAGIKLAVAHDLVVTNGAVLHLFATPVANVLTEAGSTATIGGSLLIHSNSWIMPYAEPTNGATVKIEVDGDLFVAAGGGLDADRRGYTRGYGPGSARWGRSDGGNGAGYGGHGGMSFGGRRWGDAYGDAEWPVEAGSGAAVNYGGSSHAGRGGGAIRLNVAGLATIHGTLTAKGSPGLSTHGAAGSGGAILLECRTLQGSNSGLLTVEGGQGNLYGSCGGGGRIAVHYNVAAQAALPDPVPPIRFSAYAYPQTTSGFSSTINAQVGTLWLPNTLFLTEVIDQQRFWHVQLVIPGGITETFPSLKLDNCVLTWPEGHSLTVENDLILTNEAALTLVAAATNDLARRYGMELNVGRDLRIETNCWIYPQAHPTNAAIVGIRVGRDATLARGGGIDGDRRGYHAAPGNTLGPGAGKSSSYSGGSYGGKGGGTYPGAPYGHAQLPLEPGSPAGWNGYGGASGYSVGGNGGGAVHLRAGGDLRIDGLVTVDGGFGSYYRGSGGSGGSIFLAAPRVTGSGRLSARGGKGAGEGTATTIISSGGGGRIAVWHNLPLSEIEKRLEAKNTEGLVSRSSYLPFSGEVDASWIMSSGVEDKQNPPENGSVGFYTVADGQADNGKD